MALATAQEGPRRAKISKKPEGSCGSCGLRWMANGADNFYLSQFAERELRAELGDLCKAVAGCSASLLAYSLVELQCSGTDRPCGDTEACYSNAESCRNDAEYGATFGSCSDKASDSNAELCPGVTANDYFLHGQKRCSSSAGHRGVLPRSRRGHLRSAVKVACRSAGGSGALPVYPTSHP